MRLSGVLVGLAALVACASAHAQAPGRMDVVCEQVVTFDSEDSRIAFLEANTARVVAHAATDNVFFSTSDTGPLLTIVSNVETCPPEGLAAALALEGAPPGSQAAVDPDEAYARMSRLGFAAVDTTHERVRRCVVRTTLIRPDDPTGLSVRLVYAGLRGAQVIAFEKSAYFAAEEECALVSGYLAAAFVDIHSRAPAAIACPEASFATCGYVAGRPKP